MRRQLVLLILLIVASTLVGCGGSNAGLDTSVDPGHSSTTMSH